MDTQKLGNKKTLSYCQVKQTASVGCYVPSRQQLVVSDCRTSLNKLNTYTTPITLKLKKFSRNLACKGKSSTTATKIMWRVIVWI